MSEANKPKSPWPSVPPSEWLGEKSLGGLTWDRLDEMAWQNSQHHRRHGYSILALGNCVVLLAEISYKLVAEGYAPLGIPRLRVEVKT